MSEVLPDGLAAERERMYDVRLGQHATSEEDHG
jgi:hypothetical protein